MNQGYGKSEHVEQLIRHAIEVFDLVEIVPAAKVEKSIGHQFLQSDTRNNVAQSSGIHADVSYGARSC